MSEAIILNKDFQTIKNQVAAGTYTETRTDTSTTTIELITDFTPDYIVFFPISPDTSTTYNRVYCTKLVYFDIKNNTQKVIYEHGSYSYSHYTDNTTGFTYITPTYDEATNSFTLVSKNTSSYKTTYPNITYQWVAWKEDAEKK